MGKTMEKSISFFMISVIALSLTLAGCDKTGDALLETPETMPSAVSAAAEIPLISENTPRDVINDSPLYIELEADFAEMPEFDSAREFVHQLRDWGSQLVIAYDGSKSWLYNIKLHEVIARSSYDNPDESEYTLGECILSVGVSHSPVILRYTGIERYYSRIALVLTEVMPYGDNTTHTYLIRDNGEHISTDNESEWEESNWLSVIKQEIPKKKRLNHSIIDMNPEATTLTVRFYAYDTEKDSAQNYIHDMEYYTYTEKEFSVENFAEEFTQYYSVVEDIWYEGKTICVNLGMLRGYGTTDGGQAYMSLMMTLASIPNVERIEVKNREADFHGRELTGVIINAGDYRL
ncbi:MAG: hypothetical protein FWH07_06335 [Oscillospiraceae bacterium]|nr:hypothetical protein [Oscillospiraceae bacterium]